MIKNFIIAILPVLLVAAVIPYNEPIYLYAWFLPIPIIVFLQLFFTSKLEYDKSMDVALGIIIKSKVLDFLSIIILLGLLYIIFEFCPKTRSFNAFYLPLYIFCNMYLFGQTVGCKITKIKLVNESFLDKVKIFLNNFLIISPIYCMVLKNKIHVAESAVKVLVEFLLLLNLINIFVRLFVLKKKSLFEGVLNLDYIAVK